jgi:putative acetyltransferase
VIALRDERRDDVEAIFRLHAAAFESDAEARLVDALRAAGALTLSLVAVDGDAIVGHVAFSPVTITDERGLAHHGVGLAPMAVAPSRQREGIGGRLIDEGLRRLRDRRFCVVLGHPALYTRHGFVRASTRAVRWDRPAPDEAFMIRALADGGLDGVAGVARYRPEFEAV